MSDKTARPTLRTIAQATGLGVSTVSRALIDAPEIGAKTKARVRAVAQEVGYRPNRAGIRLRTGRTNVISVVLSTEVEAFGLSSFLVHGLSSRLADTGYHLVVTPFSCGSDPIDPIRYVVESAAADGIVFADTRPDDPRARYLLDRGFPFASHGRTSHEHRHPFVDFDNRAFAEMGVAQLAAAGAQRLGFVAPPADLSYGVEMRAGWEHTIAHLGLSGQAIGDLTSADGMCRIAERLTPLFADGSLDGLLCGSASAGLAAAEAARRAGRRPGGDLQLVAKEAHDVLRWAVPGAITYGENFRRAGYDLADVLLDHLAAPDASPRSVIEKPQRCPLDWQTGHVRA
ncbi:LacI family DNA-binding transcriptional regulator [Jannaschia marina]|uniref:LacI family DNA-binding transcriptional regulator n=1 Tax=Jannaschia marina TaxID=2741674 RepID=UPI0015C80602|nr:LacI family DNA-binding transcriptional regulator [Jannaschia marina]